MYIKFVHKDSLEPYETDYLVRSISFSPPLVMQFKQYKHHPEEYRAAVTDKLLGESEKIFENKICSRTM